MTGASGALPEVEVGAGRPARPSERYHRRSPKRGVIDRCFVQRSDRPSAATRTRRASRCRARRAGASSRSDRSVPSDRCSTSRSRSTAVHRAAAPRPRGGRATRSPRYSPTADVPPGPADARRCSRFRTAPRYGRRNRGAAPAPTDPTAAGPPRAPATKGRMRSWRHRPVRCRGVCQPFSASTEWPRARLRR
jgi:hypothetical protein